MVALAAIFSGKMCVCISMTFIRIPLLRGGFSYEYSTHTSVYKIADTAKNAMVRRKKISINFHTNRTQRS